MNPTQRIAEIKERVASTTAGPWITHPTPNGQDGWPTCTVIACTARGKGNAVYATPQGGSFPGADKDFIAHARQDIPWLVEQLEELERESNTLAANNAHLQSECAAFEKGNSEYVSENARLQAENEEYRKAMSSGLCSEHREPDPLHCEICNEVSWLANANKQRVEQIEKLQAELDELKNARARVVQFHDATSDANSAMGKEKA